MAISLGRPGAVGGLTEVPNPLILEAEDASVTLSSSGLKTGFVSAWVPTGYGAGTVSNIHGKQGISITEQWALVPGAVSNVTSNRAGGLVTGWCGSYYNGGTAELKNDYGFGGVVQGAAWSYGVGTCRLEAAFRSAATFGYAQDGGTGGLAEIKSRRKGAMAGGFAVVTAANNARVYSNGRGSIAWGGAWANATAPANLLSTGRGSTALGYTTHGDLRAVGNGALAHGFSNTNSDIAALGICSFAGGYATSADILANGVGSIAHGRALADASSTVAIDAAQTGGVALGFAEASAASTANLFATETGSFSMGHVKATGGLYSILKSYGKGSWTFGYVSNGYISASAGAHASGHVVAATGDSGIYGTALGAFAHGGVSAAATFGASVNAQGLGATAFGFAKAVASSANITSEGKGSGAFGYTLDGTIHASADNSFQFGPGYNNTADTFQVGSAGLRLKGTVGAPTTPQNGDLWVDGSGNVIIRSGGVSVTIA